MHELATLPEDNVMNKINEIARRARLVQVHVHLLAYMREQVLSKWMGRKQAQEWVCSPEGMRHCYEATQRQHSSLVATSRLASAVGATQARRLQHLLQADLLFEGAARPQRADGDRCAQSHPAAPRGAEAGDA